jgi:hypothetical protein
MGASGQSLYLFLDEGGDLGFNPKGSAYFSLSAISAVRPFPWDAVLTDYKYDLWEWGLNVEYFHAAFDNRHVRGRVLGLIAGLGTSMHVDTVVGDCSPDVPCGISVEA